MSVQQTIIKGIKELLFFNDYLVIPNFGGFVLKSNTSHFSKSGFLLLPPSKTVSFNVQLKQNDGVFAIWLQEKLLCSPKEALHHLTDFSEYCLSILKTRGRLTINEIGFFYLDFESNICFEPQQDANFLSKSFGLYPVSIKEIVEEIAPIKKETTFVDRPAVSVEIEQQTVKAKRNYKKIIVPAFFSFVLISLLLLVVSNTKITGQLKASLFATESKNIYSPFVYTDLKLNSLGDGNPAYVADANGIATIELENKKIIAVSVIESKMNESSVKLAAPVSKLVFNSNAKFEIVLGCFTILENATKMVSTLKKQSVNAFITEKNNKGMYVVSNGAFETKEQADSNLIKIKNTFPKAWIKKR